MVNDHIDSIENHLPHFDSKVGTFLNIGISQIFSNENLQQDAKAREVPVPT